MLNTTPILCQYSVRTHVIMHEVVYEFDVRIWEFRVAMIDDFIIRFINILIEIQFSMHAQDIFLGIFEDFNM